MLIALLSLLAPAWSAPNYSCLDSALELPKPELPFKVPKGFAWEGLEPVATLSDGRLAFKRAATLDGLSHKSRRKQLDIESPALVMQLVLTQPDSDELESLLLPRSTLLELHALPNGGLIAAIGRKEKNEIHYFGPGTTQGQRIALPERIEDELTWREQSPYKGTAPPRLTPTGPKHVAYTFGGNAYAIDLGGRQVVRTATVWSPQISPAFPESGVASIYALELGDKLVRFDNTMKPIERRACPGCRLVSLGPSQSVHPGWSAFAAPGQAGLLLTFLRADSVLDEVEPQIHLELPMDLYDGSWGWSLRAGPGELALLSLSATTDSPVHHVYAYKPGQAEPTWHWTGAEIGGPDQRIIADSWGPLVRFRVVKGEGREQQVLRAAIFDPATGAPSGWVSPSEVGEELARPLFDASASSLQGPHATARPIGDPMMERAPNKAHRAAYRRCTIEVMPE